MLYRSPPLSVNEAVKEQITDSEKAASREEAPLVYPSLGSVGRIPDAAGRVGRHRRCRRGAPLQTLYSNRMGAASPYNLPWLNGNP